MEGGNKNKISLESGLDIKTSDMMSPVSAPKFQHNRQQYQGHYLPTSLRFEHDGWAADWDVYQFDVATASLNTSPAEFAVVKYLVNNNPSYMLVFQKETGLAQRIEYAKLWWDYETSTSTPGVSASRTGMVSSFTGQVDGKTYTVTINPVTKQYLVSAGFDLTVVIGSDGKYNVEVIDTTKTVSFSVLLKPATNMTNTDNNGKFADISSFKDNKYTWDGKSYGEFTHVLGSSQVYSVNDDKSFAANIVNGVLTAVYEYIFMTKYSAKFTNEKFIPMIYNMAAVPLSAEQGFVMNAANVFGKDSPDCMYATINTTELMDGAPIFVHGYLPLWAGISIGFNYDRTGNMMDELLLSDITKSGYKLLSKITASDDFVIYDKPVRVWSGGAFDHLEKINAAVIGVDTFTITTKFDLLVSKVPGSAWKPKAKEYFPDTKYLPNNGPYSAGYYLHGLYKFGEDELHELIEGFYYDNSYWRQEDEPVKKRQQQRIKIQKKHRKQAVDEEGNPLYLDDEGNETTEVTDTPIYETNPDGSAVYEYEFDSDGNPVYETDSEGNYVYETNPDGSLKYEYNPDGTPKYELEEDGKYVYEYDDDGEVKFELDANGLPVTGPAIDDYGNPVYVPGNVDAAEIISFTNTLTTPGNTVDYTTGNKWSVTGTTNTRDYKDLLSYSVVDDEGDNVTSERVHVNSVSNVVSGVSTGSIAVNNYMFNNVTLTLSYNMRTDSMEASGPFGPISWIDTYYNYFNSLKPAYSVINYAMTYTSTRFAIAHTYQGRFQYTISMTDPVKTDNYSEKFSVVQSPNILLLNTNYRYIDRDIGGVNSKHMIDIDHVTTYLAGNDFYIELAVKSASEDTKFFSSNGNDDFTVGTAMPDYIYYADMDRVSGSDRGYSPFNPGTNSDEYTTRFRVSGTAANVVYLTGATGLFDTQYGGTGHAFFDTTYKQWIQNNNTAITPLVGTLTKYPLVGPVYNGTQQILITINGVTVTATFTTTFTPIPAPENVILVTFNNNITNINGYNVSFSVETNTQDVLDVVLNVPLRFNLRAELASATNGSSVVSFDGNKYTMSYGGTQYTMDLDNLSADYLGKKASIDEVTGGYYCEINYRASADFTCTVKGPYKEQNIQVVSFTDTTLTVLIDGKQYTLDISNKGLFNDELKSMMTFKYTDTREKELTENIIAEIDPNNEFQFVKQQWDTTNDTENFWWVDSDHILVLTKTRLIVRRKTDEIDDWDGDVWEDEAVFLRSQFIDNNIVKYSATCAYGGDSALFWTITQVDSVKFSVSFYDPLQNMDLVRTMTFSVTKRNIGVKLVANAAAQTELYTYSDIQLSNMLSFSRFSATCRDGYIIFGIHYDNNYNQWVGVIGRTTGNQRTIQGYGFVGADGSLTGGEIPSDYYDSKIGGFTGTVEPVSILNAEKKDITTDKVSDIYKIDIGNRIVGNDTQQWYVSTEIKSIVSHLTYNGGGNFKESHLYIHNNLSQIYASGSYALRTWSDIMPWVTGLKSILPDNIDTDSTGGQAFNVVFTIVMGIGGWPSVYGISPKFNTIAYLQQTLGQYAFVHYNSTSKPDSDITEKSDSSDKAGMTTRGNLQANKDYEENDDALESDEMSFNVHSVPQSASFNKPWTGLLALCLQMYLSVSEFDPSEATVNNLQNQSAVNDKGNKYSTMFRKNMEGLASTVNLIKGAVPTTKSVVTGTLSLDMFYSTSDSQKIYAGPGYVNHNFVAQCVAQSATTNIVELNQVGMQYIISAFTMFQLEMEVKAEEFAADLLEKTADMTKEMTVSIFGNSVNIGAAIAIGLVVAANALRVAIMLQQIFLKYMPGILAGLGADQLHPGIINSVRNKDYDFEAKHKYGTKSECFMWPCFGVESAQEIDDEYAEAVAENNPWPLKMPISSKYSNLDNILTVQPINQNTEFTGVVTNKFVNINSASDKTVRFWNDAIPFYSASVKGVSEKVKLPENMAYVIGAESFLSKTAFRNENIGEGDPTFTTPPFQDYIIDKDWQLGHTATYGDTVWVSCKDTKLFDGAMSNAVISDDFCGVSSPYTAIEIKKGISRQYMRPWAITPSSLLLNNSGLNCCFEHKAYHAADGFGYRIVNWLGAPGINKNKQTLMYSFLVNDRFKRSNKMPPNEFLGNFKSDPVVATFGDNNDAVWTLTAQYTEGKGIAAGTKGEDKDSLRYSVPIFSEFVSTLPAVVKTVAAYNLDVIEGITTLTSDNRDMTTNYKAPVSVDFAIGKNMYRYTQEYICSLTQTQGLAIVENLVPCLGLTFIGSTPYEAYLYSQATRQYYSFSGGSSLQLVDMIERFRNVINGRYDFVNQEVLMPCLATFVRLDKKVQDDENEVDNIMIPRLKNGTFIGEVWPPIETIFNTRSWFRTLSMPMGIVYQGPNRCIVNRFVYSDYMLDQIKSNYGLWERVPREEYHPFRKYRAEYERVDQDIGDTVLVKGWTHNPFLLVTAPLGVSDETDCMFEWEITFCWPVEMDKLYNSDSFATVNIWAETMTPGGKVLPERPTHVYLTKELFTRTGNYGYYSFRYQSKCGAGNRERLHIWSDQYICVSGLQCEYKEITSKRTEILTQQADVQLLNEI